jgi:hypothetical protein
MNDDVQIYKQNMIVDFFKYYYCAIFLEELRKSMKILNHKNREFRPSF